MLWGEEEGGVVSVTEHIGGAAEVVEGKIEAVLFLEDVHDEGELLILLGRGL